MTDINITFCRILLKNVLADVTKFDNTINPNDAEVYISNDRKRWFTFSYRDFYYENYVDNMYDGRAKAWMAYLDKKGFKG